MDTFQLCISSRVINMQKTFLWCVIRWFMDTTYVAFAKVYQIHMNSRQDGNHEQIFCDKNCTENSKIKTDSLFCEKRFNIKGLKALLPKCTAIINVMGHILKIFWDFGVQQEKIITSQGILKLIFTRKCKNYYIIWFFLETMNAKEFSAL